MGFAKLPSPPNITSSAYVQVTSKVVDDDGASSFFFYLCYSWKTQEDNENKDANEVSLPPSPHSPQQGEELFTRQQR